LRPLAASRCEMQGSVRCDAFFPSRVRGRFRCRQRCRDLRDSLLWGPQQTSGSASGEESHLSMRSPTRSVESLSWVLLMVLPPGSRHESALSVPAVAKPKLGRSAFPTGWTRHLQKARRTLFGGGGNYEEAVGLCSTCPRCRVISALQGEFLPGASTAGSGDWDR